jgi:hypothetical protein
MLFVRTAATALAATVAFALVQTIAEAQAQQPSQAQIAVIRSSCRSDFFANCSGVQPGGKDALECLKRNLGKLSAPCKTAVSAVMPPAASAEPTAVAAPPPAPPAAAVAPPPPPPPAAAANPQPAPAAKPSPPPAPARKVTVAPHTAAAPPPAAVAVQPAPPPPAPTIAPLTLRRFILPQRRLLILTICAADAHAFCDGTPPGGERILKCLAAQPSNLSPQCYAALTRVSTGEH